MNIAIESHSYHPFFLWDKIRDVLVLHLYLVNIVLIFREYPVSLFRGIKWA